MKFVEEVEDGGAEVVEAPGMFNGDEDGVGWGSNVVGGGKEGGVIEEVSLGDDVDPGPFRKLGAEGVANVELGRG